MTRSSNRFRTCVLAVLAALASGAADAQPPAPYASDAVVRARRLAEHNHLGILEFCRAQGAIAEEVVVLQRAALERLPGAGTSGLAEAEELGRRGIVAFEASRVPIAEAAMGEGIPVASRCKQMALTVQSQAGREPAW